MLDGKSLARQFWWWAICGFVMLQAIVGLDVFRDWMRRRSLAHPGFSVRDWVPPAIFFVCELVLVVILLTASYRRDDDGSLRVPFLAVAGFTAINLTIMAVALGIPFY